MLEEKEYQKKEFLLQTGEVCKCEYFITNGLVRTFYTDANGVEKIVQFGIEYWWLTDTNSFVNQLPSQVNIQALEKTMVLAITKKNLELAYKEIPKIERLFRIISEKRLIAQQQNSRFYMKARSKERYYNLVNSIPNFAQRVPQYMLASYLDITPEYLSELRKSPQ